MTDTHRETPRRPAAAEELLFLRRWLAHPLKVGSVLPSSQFLGRLVAKHTRRGADEAVVEIGAGTGTITKELLASGIPPEKFFVIEIDADLCRFLRREVPRAQVIQGDATRLNELLPPEVIGKIRTVISGIPMVNMPLDVQRRMTSTWFEAMPADGRLLQYTYSLVSPLPEAKLGLKGRRCGIEVRNMPPAWLWSYVNVGMGVATPRKRMTLAA